MKLVLFDIDGTLIRDDGAAREALGIALREVYGFDRTLAAYDFSGRTDVQITRTILSDAGVERGQIEERLASMWEVYLRELAVRATSERVRVLSGVREILDRLRAIPETRLGLLTGNIERGARLKLSPHDLNRYFPFGAFGSDSPDREQLPPIAVERASRIDGHRFEGRDVVIIGDSIYDIRCGVRHGATTIAVASGLSSAAKLQAEGPDYCFDSLDDTRRVLDAIAAS